MSFDAPGMQEITEGGSFSQFQDFFDSTPVTDGFGKVGQQGRFVNRPVDGSVVSMAGTPIGDVSELRFPGKSPLEVMVSTMRSGDWPAPAAMAAAVGSALVENQFVRHSNARVFQQLAERNNDPGQLVKDMTVQAVNNGVDGYANPERGFFGDISEFFSDLYASESELTQGEAEKLIADLEAVKTNHPAFADATDEELANLEAAQDKLRRATQTLTSVSADKGSWNEKAANGNTLTVTVELEKAMAREGQRIALDLPAWDQRRGVTEGYDVVGGDVVTEVEGSGQSRTYKKYLVVDPGEKTATLTLQARPDGDSQDEQLGDLGVSLPGRTGTSTSLTISDLTIQDEPFTDSDAPQTTNASVGDATQDYFGDTPANDYFEGGGGSDRFEHGEGGDDWVVGGPGRDTMSAGKGADLMVGNADGDLLFGGDGSDRIHGGARLSAVEAIRLGNTGSGSQGIVPESGVYIQGSEGGDVLAGNEGKDLLTGSESNDAISGGGGDDLVVSGKGRDFVRGDTEFGSVLKNWAISLNTAKTGVFKAPVFDFQNLLTLLPDSTGNDLLYTGRGADAAFGAGGEDTVFAGSGSDYAWGGAGDDTVLGEEGDDTLMGDLASSQLPPDENGTDYLAGGGGSDRLVGYGGKDRLFGGDNRDILYGDSVTQSGKFDRGDQLEGGGGEDDLFGGGGADRLQGGDGSDLLYGDAKGIEAAYHGKDTLVGGGGSDELVGGGGADTLRGGAASDRLYGDGPFAAEAASGDVLTGGDGKDVLMGFAGNDTLLGGAAADELFGGAGADFLTGGSGEDLLAGGRGADVYTYNRGDGALRIQDPDWSNELRFGAGISAGDLSLSRGSLQINVQGAGSVHLEGFAPSAPAQTTPIDRFVFADGSQLTRDELLDLGIEQTGTGTDDNLSGTAGDDRLVGGAGDDRIDGGPGSDRINGGPGNDNLNGGTDLIDVYQPRDDSYRKAQLTEWVKKDNADSPGFGGPKVEYVEVPITQPDDPPEPQEQPLGRDRIRGGAGEDTLRGSYYADVLEGGPGDDHLAPYTAALQPNADAATRDVAKGGAGDDFYSLSDWGTRVMEGAGNGHDKVLLSVPDNQTEAWVPAEQRSSDRISYTLPGSVEDLQAKWGPSASNPGAPTVVLKGNDLANEITGDYQENRLYGGGGDDLLNGDGRWADGFHDVLYGGRGDDRYRLRETSYATDTVVERAGEGEDRILSGLGSYTLPAHVENLSLNPDSGIDGTGNPLGNRIQGNKYANTLEGRKGADHLDGGGSNDHLVGGAGDDRLFGGRNVWTFAVPAGMPPETGILREGGNYEAVVAPNRDELAGGAGDDFLDGGSGDDRLQGGAGSDTLIGGQDGQAPPPLVPGEAVTGQPRVVGELDDPAGYSPGRYRSNNDTLIGGTGGDGLQGGTGADVLTGGEGADTLAGGPGRDKARYADSPAAVTVDLASGEASGGTAAGDSLTAIEDVQGSAFDDRLTGTSGANSLRGGAGDDVLRAGAGGDRLAGEAGDDVVSGGKGADELLGGSGRDRVVYAGVAAGLTLDLADPSQAAGAAEGDSFSSIEAITGSPYSDTLKGDTSGNRLAGGAGGDTLRGRGGADRLAGGAGDDTQEGGTGADTLIADGGADVLRGGAGQDRYIYRSGTATIEDADDGNTLAFGPGIAPADITLGLGSLKLRVPGEGAVHIEGFDPDQPYAQAPVDTFRFADGTELPYRELLARGFDLYGTDGDDVVRGTAIEDRIRGLEGDDQLLGKEGDDRLFGNGGDDRLMGGAGADTLAGGTGADLAAYTDSGAGVAVDLAAGSASGGTAEGDTLRSIEGVAGSAYGDILTGGGGANVLAGGAGDDRLTGGAGADDLDGGAGFDTAGYGASGAAVSVDLAAAAASGGTAQGDTLSGIEAVTGSPHGDHLAGDEGANTLTGAAGGDTLQGRGGADTLAGGSGIDTAAYTGSRAAVGVDLAAGSGEGGTAAGDTFRGIEAVTGSAQGDGLAGASGANTLAGAGGDDTLQGRAGADTLAGGAGFDTVAYGGSGEGVGVDLAAGSAIDGTAAGDSLVGIEGVIGSGHNDFLAGDGGANRLAGRAGTDWLVGRAGGDTLAGGADSDLLFGGRGGDTASYARAGSGVTLRLGPGFGYARQASGTDLLFGMESARGSAHADRLSGNRGANRLAGGAGDDRLSGGRSGDTLTGGAGTDTADYRRSRRGVTVDLSDGTATGGTAAGDSLNGIEAVAGSVRRDRLTGDAGANTLTGRFGRDRLAGAGGADRLTGGGLPDRLAGGSGTDWATGGHGRDRLAGGSDSDALVGGAHGDRLGGDGNDLLAGGAGRDRLAAEGSDVVLHNRGEGRDRVTDLGDADKLTLSLGGGTGLDDLSLRQRRDDLLLHTGGSGRGRGGKGLLLADWYADGGSNRPESVTLQIVTQASDGFDPATNKKLNRYDFSKIVDAFDQAQAAPGGKDGGKGQRWEAMDAALDSHLASSDSEALGGELAHRYGTKGSLEGASRKTVLAALAQERFGEKPQDLQGSGSA
ncbi:MAG: hypothetical protein V5A50_11025 [Thiohalorhabdus sp.]